MLNALGLGFLFTARDEASAVMEKIKGNLEKLKESGEDAASSITGSIGKATKFVASSVAAIAAVTAVASFGLAGMAGRFESAITSAGAIAGASAKEFDMLREAALQAGLAAQFTPVEATKALQDLAAAGFNVKESIGLLKPVLDLAGGSLGQLSPSDAAGLAAQAMKAFGLSVDEAGISVDRMLQSVNMFALEAKDLPLSLGIASRGAQVMNQNLSETLIALGLVKNVIPSIERSATGVAVAMERLVDPEWQGKLKGIGVSVTDSNGKFRSFLDILNEMAPKLAKMSDADSSAFLLKTFGHHSLGAISAIMTQLTNGVRTSTGELKKGADAVAYLRDQFENAGGTAAKFRDLMNNTYDGQKQMLKSAIETAGIMLGEPFKEYFKGALKSANVFVRGLIQVFSEGEFSGAVRDALDKNLGVKDAVIKIYVWVERIRNFLRSLAASFSQTFEQFSPLLDRVATGIGTVGTALGIVNQTAEQNADAFDEFGNAGAGLGGMLAYVAGVALEVLVTALELVVEGVMIMRGVWEKAGGTIMSFVQIIKGAFQMIGGLFTGDWKMFWNGFVDVAVGAAKIVVNIVYGLIGVIAHAIDKFNSFVGINSTWEAAAQAEHKMIIDRVDHGGGVEVLKYNTSNHPGVAASASAAAAAASPVARPENPDGGAPDTHLRVDLHLDGERLLSQMSTIKRSSDVRSFGSARPEGAF